MKYFQSSRRDGFGSVFLQIIGSAGVAEKYNCTFVCNDKIQKLHHGVTFDNIAELIDIKKIFPSLEFIETEESYKLFELENLKENNIITVENVHSFIEKTDLNIYERGVDFLRPFFKKIPIFYNKDYTNIAIHIRRGDITEKIPSRFVNIKYYINLILKLKTFNWKKPCKFYIYTQKNRANPEELLPFLEIKNVNIILDENDRNKENNAIIDWVHLTEADVLITGKSAYSYTAAMFNTRKIIFLPFWHPPLSGWLVNDLENKTPLTSFLQDLLV